MSTEARPIRLLGRHALTALEARVQAALEDALAGWLQPQAGPVALRLRTPQRGDADGRGDRGDGAECGDRDELGDRRDRGECGEAAGHGEGGPGGPRGDGPHRHDRQHGDVDAGRLSPADRVAGDGSRAALRRVFERFDGAHGTLWIRGRPSDRRAWLRASLGEAFCGAEDAPADAWAAAVAEEGWQARNAALCAALTGTAGSMPADRPDEALYAFGSGAVQIEAAALGLFLLADAGVLRHVPPRAGAVPGDGAPRVPLDRAAARADVSLDVSVGRVEIGLRTLLELRPGDVLRLPTRLDDTLPLGPPAAPLRCALGESAGRAAVRICPTNRMTA